jgi:O-antigen/teichoic acid export membrane protein
LFETLRSARVAALIEAAVAAACNFLISVFVARSFDAAVFSGYITALSAAFVAIAFLRVSFVTPTAVKPDAWYHAKLKRLAAIHVLSIIAAMMFVTIVLVAVAVLFQTPLWIAAASFAPGICLWFVGQEFERSLLLKKGHNILLLTVSAVQIFSLVVTLLLIWHYKLPFEVLAAAMALFGVSRSVAAISVARGPSWREGIEHLGMGVQRLGGGASAYLLGSVACSHAPVFALALYGLPEQSAAFGAMRTLFQPAQIFFRSRDVVGQTQFYADSQKDATPLMRQFAARLFRTAGLSAALGTVLALAGPWLVKWIYAGRFADHMTTLWLWAGIMVLINLAATTDAFVSYLGLLNHYATAQIFGGLLCVVMSAVLVVKFGDVGAAVAALCGWLFIVGGGAFLIASHSKTRKT